MAVMCLDCRFPSEVYFRQLRKMTFPVCFSGIATDSFGLKACERVTGDSFCVVNVVLLCLDSGRGGRDVQL